jgi:succinate dehydrogenase/fumarate reductase-like Fe-S protein
MSQEKDLATVRVLRFDQATGGSPHWQVFRNVPYLGRRVLDVLAYLMEHEDSSLGFRDSCRIGVCAACLVTLNGKAVLSCKVQAEREMDIGPPRRVNVLKDTAPASRRNPAKNPPPGSRR